MTLKPFTPEELVEWVEEEVGRINPPGGYVLRPNEYTARSFKAELREGGREATRKQAYDALERLVERGLMDKRKELIGNNMTNVYRRLEVVPEEDER